MYNILIVVIFNSHHTLTRSREVGIAMAKLPASRHIKQAIINMDSAHITRESINVRINYFISSF